MSSSLSNSSVATMREVALEAGCSKMTVSRVLRNAPNVKASTRKRVLEAMERVGYQELPANKRTGEALRLARPRNRITLAVISLSTRQEETRNASRMRIWEGIRREAELVGFRLDELYPVEDGLSPARVAGILEARGIRCVLFTPPPQYGFSFPMSCASFCVAAIGTALVEPRVLHVANNDHQQAFFAVNRLYDHGYRRIGLAIPADLDSRHIHSNFSGYLGACHLHPDLEALPIFDTQHSGGRLRDWLDTQRVDAVIGRVETYDGLRNLGLNLPEDIGFVGVGTGERAGEMALMEIPLEELGRHAVRVINSHYLSNQSGELEHPRTVLIDGIWREGPSVRENQEEGGTVRRERMPRSVPHGKRSRQRS